jgi:hypothetical protein
MFPKASVIPCFAEGRTDEGIPVVHFISLLFLLAGPIPAAAATQVLNGNNAEYLGLLGQKGTQIIADIVQSENVLKANANRPDFAANLLALEKLRNDMRLMTLEGDHLQSVITIARRMGDPADQETVLLFVKVIAEEAARSVQSLRDDVLAIAGAGAGGTPVVPKAKQVLSFMEDFANVVDAIARQPRE